MILLKTTLRLILQVTKNETFIQEMIKQLIKNEIIFYFFYQKKIWGRWFNFLRKT